MICSLLALAMLFQNTALAGASVCDHADGSRRIEWPAAHAECHADSDDDLAGPSIQGCSDGRPIATPAIVHHGLQRLLPHPLTPLPVLVFRVPDLALRAGLRSDTQLPPNTPLLSICTVILLI